MKLSAEGGQAKPVAANATGFNPWKFNRLKIYVLVRADSGNRVNIVNNANFIY